MESDQLRLYRLESRFQLLVIAFVLATVLNFGMWGMQIWATFQMRAEHDAAIKGLYVRTERLDAGLPATPTGRMPD